MSVIVSISLFLLLILTSCSQPTFLLPALPVPDTVQFTSNPSTITYYRWVHGREAGSKSWSDSLLTSMMASGIVIREAWHPLNSECLALSASPACIVDLDTVDSRMESFNFSTDPSSTSFFHPCGDGLFLHYKFE
jgi:hypothetical protein